MSKEQLEGFFWKVTATLIESGSVLTRVTDERGIQLMKECGYFILNCEKIAEVN